MGLGLGTINRGLGACSGLGKYPFLVYSQSCGFLEALFSSPVAWGLGAPGEVEALDNVDVGPSLAGWPATSKT